MAETATQFMTGIRPDVTQPDAVLETLLYKLTIVYKCYGKRLSQSDKAVVCEAFELFAKRGIMKGTWFQKSVKVKNSGDNLFNDNRSCVVHVLDSLYRAESQEELSQSVMFWPSMKKRNLLTLYQVAAFLLSHWELCVGTGDEISCTDHSRIGVLLRPVSV